MAFPSIKLYCGLSGMYILKNTIKNKHTAANMLSTMGSGGWYNFLKRRFLLFCNARTFFPKFPNCPVKFFIFWWFLFDRRSSYSETNFAICSSDNPSAIVRVSAAVATVYTLRTGSSTQSFFLPRRQHECALLHWARRRRRVGVPTRYSHMAQRRDRSQRFWRRFERV